MIWCFGVQYVQTCSDQFLLHEYFGGWSHSHCFRLLCRMGVAWLPKSWTYKGLEWSWGPGWDMLRFIVICIDSCLFLSLRQLPPQGGIATVLSWFHGLVVAFKGAIPWLSLGCWHLLVHSCHSLLLLLKSRLNPRHVWPVSASERKSWFQLVPNTCPYPFKRNQSPDMTSLQQDLCCKIPWRFQSALSQLNIDLWHSKVCQTGMMEVSRVMSSSFS